MAAFMSAALLLTAAVFQADIARAGEPAVRRFTAEQPRLGTLVRITVYAPEAPTAVRAFQAAFQRIDELDRVLSDYRTDSELNRLSRFAGVRPVGVSDDLFRVLRAGTGIAEASGGAFDMTTGALTRLWREARRDGEFPAAKALLRARELRGADQLVLDASRPSAYLKKPGILLDLGGIAKGFVADEVLALLRGLGLRRALVAVGGDIAVGDPPPGKDGWRITADTAEDDAGERPALLLSNRGVSTSGDREQFLEHDGERYSHILSPRTGEGLSDGLAVTVVADSAMAADGWATAIRVLGEEAASPLIGARSELSVLVSGGGGAGVRRYGEIPLATTLADRDGCATRL